MTDQAHDVSVPDFTTYSTDERPKDALSAIAAFHVNIDPSKLNSSGWAPGPLPVSVTLDDTFHSKLITATETWRRNIVLPQAADLLYGGQRHTARWHLQYCADIAQLSSPSGMNLTGTGAEVLVLPPFNKKTRFAVLVIHLDLNVSYPTDDRQRCMIIAQMNSLTRGLLKAGSGSNSPLQWEFPEQLNHWLPIGCSAAPGYLNAFTGIHLLSHVGSSASNHLHVHEGPDTWTSADFWDWHLAMCSPPTQRQIKNISSNIPPEPGEALHLAQSKVRLTRLGFVQRARIPTTKGTYDLALQDLRRFRTIYTDAIFMVMAQQRLLDWLSEETSRVEDPGHDTARFQAVASNLRIFRNRWWIQEYTNWQQPDRLMRHLQKLTGLDRLFDDLKEDHEFFATIAQAAESMFFNRTLLALTFFSVINCVAAVLGLFGDNFHQTAIRAWFLAAASIAFGTITYMLLRRSGLKWRRR